jgi:hypothetical protein
MSLNQREVKEGTQHQGENEKINYSVDTTQWGGTPTIPSVVVKDQTNDYLDVTTTVMPGATTPGAITITGNVIILPKLQALTKGRIYRVEIAFTSQGQDLEPYFLVAGEM